MSSRCGITSLLRVPLFLRERDVRFEAIFHPPAFTAQNRARVLQVPGERLAKCVLLAARKRFALAVLPATHKVALDSLTAYFGDRPRVATDDEMAAVFRDCEWGVMAPFGSVYGIPTILDNAFPADAPITFEVHLHVLALRMLCRDYERVEKPVRLSFAHRLL